jgi:DNA ligase 1
MKVFPTLYSSASTGKIKEWNISVSHLDSAVEIITVYGYIDGKKTETSRIVNKGKNIGKANETSPYEQAISEAQSKWNKKKDEGYTEKKPTTITKKSGDTVLPMLALDYSKRGHDIQFPCFVQPKLDGVRALFYNNSLWSRKGKEFLFLEHIKDEAKKIDIIMDGEIYSETLSFQEMTGLVRKKKLSKEDIIKSKQIKWVVYDYVSDDDYHTRYDTLLALFKKHRFKNIELLKTEICNKKTDINKYLQDYEKAGYEGLIVRNFKGSYKQQYRSKDLQKYKNFMDDEFKVVDFTEGDGIEKGLVIWICETKTKARFSVRPQGTHEERAELFKKGNKYIGKMLTVKYQEVDKKTGIPRFPVGIAFRLYE